MGTRLPSVSFLGKNGKDTHSTNFLSTGRDGQFLGILIRKVKLFSVERRKKNQQKLCGTSLKKFINQFWNIQLAFSEHNAKQISFLHQNLIPYPLDDSRTCLFGLNHQHNAINGFTERQTVGSDTGR